jgi:hypothetical protein
VANAGPITVNPDVINSAGITLTVGTTPACPADFVCDTSFISYVHDITDNGFTIGDKINSAILNIFLTDLGGSEIVRIAVALGQTLTVMNTDDSSTQTLVLDADSIADLEADGLISVTVGVQQHGGPTSSFVFDHSELTVFTENTGDQNVNANALPEPAPLALLGLGLAGLAWSRRKK